MHVPGNFKCQVMFKCAAVRCWPARRRPGEKKSRCIQGHLGSVLTAAGLRAPSGGLVWRRPLCGVYLPDRFCSRKSLVYIYPSPTAEVVAEAGPSASPRRCTDVLPMCGPRAGSFALRAAELRPRLRRGGVHLREFGTQLCSPRAFRMTVSMAAPTRLQLLRG